MRNVFTFAFLLLAVQGVSQSKTDSLLEAYERLEPDDTLRPRVLYQLGKTLFQTGNLQAEDYLLQAIKETQENDQYQETYINSRLHLASFYLNRGEWLKAEQHLDTTRYYCSNIENKKCLAIIYIRLGMIQYEVSNNDRAKHYYELALDMAGQSDDKLLEANAYLSLANVASVEMDHDLAIEYYLKVIPIYESLNLPRSIGVVHGNIAFTYLAIKEYDKAILCSRKALVYHLKTGNRKSEAFANRTIGKCLLEMQLTDSAAFYLNRSQKLFRKVEDKNNHAVTTGYIGVNHALKGNTSKAVELLTQSISALKKFDNHYAVANFSLRRGIINTQLQKYAEAVEDLSEAYRIAKISNAREIEMQSLRAHASLDSARGDYQRAYMKITKYQQLKDSIFTAQSDEKLNRKLVEYETREKEKELDLQKSEIRLLTRQRENARIKTWLWGGGILTFTIILLLLLNRQLIKNRKDKELIRLKYTIIEQELKTHRKQSDQLRQEVNYKDQEIEKFAMNIVEKDELLDKLRQEVSALSKKSALYTGQLKVITSLVSNSINLNKQNQEFESHVNNVYKSFFQRLSLKFPELTENEKRLAALLKLNLSSKQIASLLSISPKSVDMNRYRLRKKINIDSDQRLDEFLSSF